MLALRSRLARLLATLADRLSPPAAREIIREPAPRPTSMTVPRVQQVRRIY
ncbi:hypothetical protein [Rhodococcoides fascians]|uniref:hypothetical protein n=1 Tax=Rhodococcoides fascians TaxID=1828 RepID=UPI000AD5B2CD|nr:hypothetical protein [Rhodococcus fascians]